MVVAALNILAVCDPGTDFGRRLAEYAEKRAGYPFSLQVFSSLDQLFLYREKRKPEAVLLASELYREGDWQDYDHPLFLLGSGLGREGDPPCIFRYQEADSILREILVLYRQKRPKFAMKTEKRGFCLYAVTDAAENCRSEQLAFALAVQLAAKEKVLWLDLRTWSVVQTLYGGMDSGTLGELLYGLCRRKEDVLDQMMEKAASVQGVDVLPGIAEPADFLELTIDDWKYLFDRLKNESPYTAVLAVTGNMIQPLGAFLELFDVIWMVWEEGQMACQNRLEKYVKTTACPQLWQRVVGVQLPADTAGKDTDRQVLRQLAIKTLREDKRTYGRKDTSQAETAAEADRRTGGQ